LKYPAPGGQILLLSQDMPQKEERKEKIKE
jgi:hypothetical protein